MGREKKPNIVDVEASGFGDLSYPIEVGVALEDGSKYCALIMPAPDWTHWDEQAESVHRIARDILETYGKPIRQITEELNQLLEGKTIYTDAWVVDRPWLTTLFAEAGMEMKFRISALEMILSERQMECWHETKDNLLSQVNKPRHRASFDAWLIQETYLKTLA